MQNEKILNFGADFFSAIKQLPGIIFQDHYHSLNEICNSYYNAGYADERGVHSSSKTTVAKFTIKPKR